MIEKCKCPKCGTCFEEYWANEEDVSFGMNEVSATYLMDCECGHTFYYVENYKLSDAYVNDNEEIAY